MALSLRTPLGAAYGISSVGSVPSYGGSLFLVEHGPEDARRLAIVLWDGAKPVLCPRVPFKRYKGLIQFDNILERRST